MRFREIREIREIKEVKNDNPTNAQINDCRISEATIKDLQEMMHEIWRQSDTTNKGE